MNNKLTIFLSHSHKDLDKVRKLRDILESLEFEPLIFCLKCLDDNCDELEDFIKREIDARSVFVYCKSKNSEQSSWVQKELQYIRQSDFRRVYTIDIDRPLHKTFVTLLNSLCKIIKNNTVYISFAYKDKMLGYSVEKLLDNNGYKCFNEYDLLNNSDDIKNVITQIVKNGIFMPIITVNYMKSIPCLKELECLFSSIDYSIKPLVLPLIVKNNISDYDKFKSNVFISKLLQINCLVLEFDEKIREVDKLAILSRLREITIKHGC